MPILDNVYSRAVDLMEGQTLHAAIGLAQSRAAITRYDMCRGLGQHDCKPSHRVQVLDENWWSSLPGHASSEVNQVSY